MVRDWPRPSYFAPAWRLRGGAQISNRATMPKKKAPELTDQERAKRIKELLLAHAWQERRCPMLILVVDKQ